jgi:hypothetical protein
MKSYLQFLSHLLSDLWFETEMIQKKKKTPNFEASTFFFKFGILYFRMSA